MKRPFTTPSVSRTAVMCDAPFANLGEAVAGESEVGTVDEKDVLFDRD